MARRNNGPRTRLAPELRRAQIIEAAIEVFAGREPSEVTFEEIAEAAGVSRALVYNYFGDRGGLLGAVCLRCFEQLDDAIAPAFDPSLRPSQQAREWIRRYLTFAAENPAPWSMIGSATASQHPAVQEARQRRIESVVERWGGGPEVRIIAASINGLLLAGMSAYEELDDDLEFDRLVDILGVFAWKGLGQLIPSGIATHPPAFAKT
ncbi:TetR/AcrR family transcriptional regulator [Actinomarinicola tropica]|uniref:TetR/AcrR family transcriptional regulator n=1 Tax=Actinomarinicola tropica TaxID=2789776 RepID=UPI00189BC2B1|nr:TetR/AcrR family transcriptional regulator [Actinomarinicola tropica]